MKMLQDNVLVVEAAKETTTTMGIILTSDVSKASKPGLIMSVGPEVEGIEAGDRVFLDWGKSLPVDVEGRQGVIIAAEHIKAVL